ncbi:methionine--tRNA ligase [Nonomuraea aurantiaca]|uniref:methionine--tRNA ligase n=1 Tax=Nonomuraea aurantiaca TaxID=2878562 RepID=UPI001CD93EC7|nr:methionine--tRNA ligase [Nonomuraea aurantiaca]MCA2220023.1 methionine--tRNA ligase [Nonomuraea aurantiaca]
MAGQNVFTGVAWPYASGPRHIGHVAGFGVPSDVFSRFERMRGNHVLMVSGTDEHGTPILLAADAAGVRAKDIADKYSRVISEDLCGLGLSYDLFTRTTTRNHYSIVQEMFRGLHDNGYIFSRSMLGAISPSTGRTLPDRYIEGTCPHCGDPGARGDQCDHCSKQLDPIDLLQPRSRVNGETPAFVKTEHFFLDLRAFGEVLGGWLQTRQGWRPNVLKFTMNLLNDLAPRAISRDLDWGVPIPLDGWADRQDKRLYVWFDAVIGYIAGSVEWARRTGDPDAWKAWWHDPDARAHYFMGKDNVVFHSVMWPSILLGYNGEGSKGGTAGRLGRLNLPERVVSSEFLTMEGRKFSSSRDVVIHVRDFLSRYSSDSLRYYLAAAGPETADTDFTWSAFVSRNNDELVAGWGNLVNRTVSMAAKYFGGIPEAGALNDLDHELLASSRASFGLVGDLLEQQRQRAALAAVMKVVASANKYTSEQRPWALHGSDPERAATVVHVALQVVDDCKSLLTPFLPESSERVHRILGGSAPWSGMPELREVEEDGETYTVLMGDYSTSAVWKSVPIKPGIPLSAPGLLFQKLDSAIVEDELERMGGGAG